MKKKRIKPILHLALSLFLAWMITNGWSYILLYLGIIFKWGWAKAVGGGYLAMLWMPWTPEKILTIPIAIFIHKLLFPADKSIVRWLKLKLYKFKQKLKTRKKRSD